MQKKLFILVLFFESLTSILGTYSYSADAWDSGWEEIDDSDGIKVFKKEVPGQPAIAVRGIATIDAPLARVASVVADVSHYLEWVALLAEVRFLKKQDDLNAITYQRFDMPIVMKDRDLVLQMKGELDKKNNTFKMKMTSVEDPTAPPPHNVRANCLWSFWDLKGSPDGKSTRAEVKALVDPMGSTPKWIINWSQKKWPYDTLKTLREQVKKPSVEDLPVFRVSQVTEGTPAQQTPNNHSQGKK